MEMTIDVAGLAAAPKDGKATVIDLSLSPAYRKGHIPGAWFAIRSRLKEALGQDPDPGRSWCSPPKTACWPDWRCPTLKALTDAPVALPHTAAMRPGSAPGYPLSTEEPAWPTSRSTLAQAL